MVLYRIETIIASKSLSTSTSTEFSRPSSLEMSTVAASTLRDTEYNRLDAFRHRSE